MFVPVSKKSISRREIEAAKKAVDEEVWTENHFCNEFRNKIKETLGIKHCVLVNSGSSANLVALAALKIARNWNNATEVITCALGFPTTVNPILQLGMTPVFVDSNGLNINVDQIEGKITSNTKAIMIAHTLGFPFDVKRIRQLCNKYELSLVEDTCDAFGSYYNDRPCGTFGDVSTLSFYPAHMVTSVEGGAVLTNDDRLGRLAEMLTNWGRDCRCLPGQDNSCGKRFSGQFGKLPEGYDHKYVYAVAGYNLKMSDIHAAIGGEQMDKFHNFVIIRQDNYRYYERNIFVECEPLGEGVCPFGFVMYIKDAMQFIKKLDENGIGARLMMGGNLTRQPYLCDTDWGTFPNADKMMKSTVWIGVQPSLEAEEKDYVIDTINKLTIR